MDLGRKNMKKIRGLILFTAVVVLGLVKFEWLCQAVFFLISIIRPFLIGAAIAFVLNLPMSFYEKKLFGAANISEKKKARYDKMKRPVSLVLAFLSVILVITFVILTVIPQLVSTIKVLTKEIPAFGDNVLKSLESMLAANPDYQKVLSDIEIPVINWEEMIKTVVNFLKNGMGSLAVTTFSVASSIVSGTVNFFIALVFSFYILIQKEKLGDQFRRFIKA